MKREEAKAIIMGFINRTAIGAISIFTVKDGIRECRNITPTYNGVSVDVDVYLCDETDAETAVRQGIEFGRIFHD